MERWRLNLYVLWACNFMVLAGFSLVIPFLPLYLKQIGVRGEQGVEFWSGVVFAANFFTMALVSPLWGVLADRSGRKLQMLRSGYGMAAMVALMGLVGSVWQLVGLRLLQGVFAGFIPASTAFVAATTPRAYTGYALGLLQTGGAAGSIVGPLLGGLLTKALGSYRPIFFITAAASALGATVVLLTVREEFTPAPRGPKSSLADDFRLVLRNRVLRVMTVVYFLGFFSVMTVEPVLTLFLKTLDTPARWVDVAAGGIFSASGLATVIAAPIMGRRADRVGYRRTLLTAALAGVGLFVLQGLVTAAWQLLALRFALGLCLGAFFPSASALVARAAGPEMQGRAFSLTNMALFMGNVLGPLTGGAVGAYWGQRAVFPVTAAVLAATVAWIWFMVPPDRPPGAEDGAASF